MSAANAVEVSRLVSPLIEKWDKQARRKFEDAKHESDEMGKKLIEHGAMCYFNAARELESLSSSQLPASNRQEEVKTSKKLKV